MMMMMMMMMMYVCIISTLSCLMYVQYKHVCAIQVCIYGDGGSYDDPKIDWLEADHFKWSVIIDLVLSLIHI